MNKIIKTVALALLLCIPAVSNVHACYVDFTKHDIERCTGSEVIFHAEYEAQEEKYNQISFPKSLCHPVYLDTTGDTRWFFTSALTGATPYLGEAIVVTKDAITRIYLVSGSTRNGNWVYIYFGLDTNNPKFQNKTHVVYRGNPLFVVCKDNSHTVGNDAKYFDNVTIESEVRKHLPDEYKNCDYSSQIFYDTFANLFLWRDGACYTHGHLISSKSFWAPTGVIKTRQYKNG